MKVSIEERINELSKILDSSSEDIVEAYGGSNLFETPDGDFLVLTSKEAYDDAKEEIFGITDELGLEAFSKEMQSWIVDNALETNWFEDTMRDYYESYIEDIRDEDGRLEEEMEDAGCLTEEDFLEYLCNDENPKDWYESNFGTDSISTLVKKNVVSIDKDMVADECIKWDGIAHELARYDGNEIELGEVNGEILYAYRVN